MARPTPGRVPKVNFAGGRSTILVPQAFYSLQTFAKTPPLPNRTNKDNEQHAGIYE